MHKLISAFFLIFLSLSVYPQDTIPNPQQFEAYWKQGFHIKSKDGNFDLKFGGRIMNDWAFYSQEQAVQEKVGKLYSGTEFRRLRFFNSGTFYNSFSYKLQFDFAGGAADVKDAYIKSPDIPYLGNIIVGHSWEPFGMEQTTSSKYITFMERSLTEVFPFGRSTGIKIKNGYIQDRISWAAGVFRSSDDFGSAHSMIDYHNITARIWGQPIYNKKKEQVVHLGVAYSFRTPNDRVFSTGTPPETHMSPDYINTGPIRNVSDVTYVGYEGALIWGPFSFQGEFMTASLQTDTSTRGYLFSSYYGMLSVFLTGDHRGYEPTDGTGGRVYPNNNFMNGKGGLGAIEATLRYSGADLTDNNVEGGILNDLTAGLNWYPNPSTKIMLNYQYAQLRDVGFTHIFQTRFQVDF